jgi:hypothetical protein
MYQLRTAALGQLLKQAVRHQGSQVPIEAMGSQVPIEATAGLLINIVKTTKHTKCILGRKNVCTTHRCVQPAVAAGCTSQGHHMGPGCPLTPLLGGSSRPTSSSACAWGQHWPTKEETAVQTRLHRLCRCGKSAGKALSRAYHTTHLVNALH